MTARKHTPQHDFWTPRVEGQIRHTIGRHPEWFVFKGAREKQNCVNSLAKRITGEIVAGSNTGHGACADEAKLSTQAESGGVLGMPLRARGVDGSFAPSDSFTDILSTEQRAALGYLRT